MNNGIFNSFWVIFDTCTQPPYYQDVHNVLSMPRGSIIRYNYSLKLLSREANRFAQEFPKAPLKVLLMYGQYKGFDKGDNEDDKEKFKPGETEMIWVPTRLAEMSHILVKEDNCYLDLKLLSFPFIDKGLLRLIIDDLKSKKETPFDLWVTISGKFSELNSLEERGDSDTNWSHIVRWFQEKQTQFKNDSFWQLRGPFDASNNKQIHLNYDEQKRQDKVLQKTSYLSLYNQQEIWFEVVNREPRVYQTRHTESGTETWDESRQEIVTGRSLHIDDRSGRIRTETPEVPLRPYFTQSIKLLVHADRLLTSQDSIVSFKTVPQTPEWPNGPNFNITFRTQWMLHRLLLGGFFMILGLTLIFAGNKLPIKSFSIMWVNIILFIIGTFCIVLSSYILYRELKFKY